MVRDVEYNTHFECKCNMNIKKIDFMGKGSLLNYRIFIHFINELCC